MKVNIQSVSYRQNTVEIIGTVDNLPTIATCSYTELQKIEEENRGQHLAEVLAQKAGATGASNAIAATGEYEVSMDQVNSIAEDSRAKVAAATSTAASAPTTPPISRSPRREPRVESEGSGARG